MLCPTCKKDFEKGVETAYRFGLIDGGSRLLNATRKQLRAFFLVEVMLTPKIEAGRIMGGISHQAVSGLLRRLRKNRNRLKKL